MQVRVPLPVNIETGTLSLFEPYTRYEVSPLYVKRLKNVFITHSGLAINKNGLIKECCHDYPEQQAICSQEAAFYYYGASEDPDKWIDLDNEHTYLLIHHPWYNYYHWICECILRLWLVREKKDAMILLLPDYYEQSDFITGSLEPFEIKKRYYIPQGKSVFVRNLCLPQIKPVCDSYHVDKLIEIRKFYLNYVLQVKKINIQLGERIYLSRKKAARKKVVNEADVEKVLSRYDFTIVYNEDYSFLEQVSIYANARYLVSIHGSGLTNMLFMKEGSTILEFHKVKTNTLDRPSFVFWYQAAALGFRYFHQVCEPITEDDDYFFGDFEIDIPLLEKNLAAVFA
ncbi:glycosyltransferase family 61 protein [Longitalea luteola]|uniref:glycosyltransferase family 61 protein n=1 Tax=Longitalea luteola TaxID=2812563 RepID=UPI001A97839D|nr:glycosyltransferase family 61 protein [Longitalea luteola]